MSEDLIPENPNDSAEARDEAPNLHRSRRWLGRTGLATLVAVAGAATYTHGTHNALAAGGSSEGQRINMTIPPVSSDPYKELPREEVLKVQSNNPTVNNKAKTRDMNLIDLAGEWSRAHSGAKVVIEDYDARAYEDGARTTVKLGVIEKGGKRFEVRSTGFNKWMGGAGHDTQQEQIWAAHAAEQALQKDLHKVEQTSSRH